MSRKGSKMGNSPAIKVVSSSDAIILKLILHSKEKGSPKFLKYIQHAKKTFSSSNLKLWMDLRTKGGLHAIESVLRNLVDVEFVTDKIGPELKVRRISSSPSNTSSSGRSKHHDQAQELQRSCLKVEKDVCITGLSVLGNAYSLDYAARKEVATNGFIDTLHRFIQKALGATNSSSAVPTTALSPSVTRAEGPKYESGRIDITTRAVKCIANLAHDSSCRDIILKSGVGISVLKILEGFNQLWTIDNVHDREKPGPKAEVGIRKWSDDEKECIRSCIRAIRILSSEPFCSEDAKNHLIRFGAVITIGKTLTWCSEAFPQDDFTLEIIRALISLTDRIRLLPSDQIEELVCEEMGNTTLKKLVEVFNNCTDEGKLFSPTIRCLTHFSYNIHIAESLGRLLIFKIALEKLKQSSRTEASEICRLLLTLTKHSSVNKCVLNNCQEIWSTLTILKSTDSQEYHRWVLHVYENVYEGSLKSLLRNGLIELIHDHLKEELEDCDYEILKRKIMSLEDDSCRVHATTGCQFVPVYRCDSPSYQQVQEEVKVRLQDREILNKMEIDSSSSGVESSSPSSSPARSWASEESIPSSSSELGGFRAGSPTSASDDEGCYSPVYSFASSSPSYSQQASPDRDVGMSDDENPSKDSFLLHRSKRPRLEADADNTTNERVSFNPRKSSENIKAKSKKIVSMLNILQKCTHLSPVPQNLVQVIPMLLSFIVRGIVSLTPHGHKYAQNERDLESIVLGKQSFSLAYRILKTMCLNINMFPEFVKHSTISIVFRLLIWDKHLEGLGSNQSARNLLGTLSGFSNDTAGWREGYLLRTLLISKCEDELDRISLVIPLLFRKNDHVLRNFETKGRSWSRVFELLTKTDEINFSKFQDCILTLSSLCDTVGMRWTDADEIRNRPLLLKIQTEMDFKNVINVVEEGQEVPMMEEHEVGTTTRVELLLDDKTRILVAKDILTQASPVFSAMFDGNFIEAGEQKVRIRDISKEAIKALVEQIILLNQTGTPSRQFGPINIDCDQYELSTLFELTSLSDQFLLEGIYERTLNSLLCFYICPYSAPMIYMEAVKLAALWKPQSRLRGWQLDLTYLILKYLLVGDMSMSSRCGAFRKIFDSVSPEIVVGDMRALVEYFCTRPQSGR